jgi:hypothetical protein
MGYKGGMVEETAEQKLQRHEHALELCMAEIQKLRAENAALRSADGAIDVLRNIYRDESAPRSDRIKAANGAIAYEQPKILPVQPAMNLVADDPDSNLPLAELVTKRRARQNALEPPYRVLPGSHDVVLLKGNGNNSNDH